MSTESDMTWAISIMILCISIIPEVVYILEAGEQMKIQAKEKIHMIPINYVFFWLHH